MDIKKALPFIAIPAGIVVLLQIARARAASLRPVSYRLDFSTGRAILYIKCRLVNPSDIPYALSNIFLNVNIDGRNIGTISPQKTYDIPRRADIFLELPLILNTGEVINIIKEFQTLRRQIQVRGVIYIGGILVRVNERIGA
jgi:LEA14-like dessication related protein